MKPHEVWEVNELLLKNVFEGFTEEETEIVERFNPFFIKSIRQEEDYKERMQILEEKIKFEATPDEWMAIWNAIQIGVGIDKREKVNKKDLASLSKVKTRMIEDRYFQWVAF